MVTLRRRFYVVFFFIFATSGGKEITYNDVIEKTVAIIQTCIASNLNNILLLAGEYNEFLQRPALINMSVALIAASKSSPFDAYTLTKYSYTMHQRYYFLHLLRKLNRFVAIASSQPSLRLTLQKIKDSTWANAEGFHIIIDRKTEERGCVNAYQFLWTAWEYDLIYSVFLCIDPVEGLVLFTYDPYAGHVPPVWQVAERFRGRRGHPWLLLKRKYQDVPNICEELKFDKTNSLNGYEVRLNAIPVIPFLKIDRKKKGLDMYNGDNSEIIKIIFAKLNATMDVTLYNVTAYDVGGIGPKGHVVGMLTDVNSGRVDMGMNARSLYAMWKFRYTYPHANGGLCVITQKTGRVSEFRKIMQFMSPAIGILLAVCSLITFFFLTRFSDSGRAFLNIIRLATTVSMTGIPSTMSARIFVANISFLCVIINALFQGHWSSLLTVPVSQPNIKTFADLEKSGYAIFGPSILELAIAGTVFESRYRSVSYHECKAQVLKSKRAACLGDCLQLYNRIKTNELHHSQKMRELLEVYVTRENWPPYERVNSIIQRIVEGGFVLMWREQHVRKLLSARLKRRVRNRTRFRTVQIKHLTFSFHLLGIGYSFAILVFVAEIFIKRRRNSIEKSTTPEFKRSGRME